jgi:tRNA threonylcarbamoyladenosine biosynthesis protein TsaE
MKKIIKTHSEKETFEEAERMIKEISGNFNRLLIFLEGELGAGKTVFAKGVGKAIGIVDIIESPTFVFVREYCGKIPLYHFDLYRIDNVNQLDELGFFEYIDRSGITIVEWAEKVGDIVEPDIIVNIEKVGENERKITIDEK